MQTGIPPIPLLTGLVPLILGKAAVGIIVADTIRFAVLASKCAIVVNIVKSIFNPTAIFACSQTVNVTTENQDQSLQVSCTPVAIKGFLLAVFVVLGTAAIAGTNPSAFYNRTFSLFSAH